MKKIFALVIAVAAISFVSCDSKTEKAEKEITEACVCETCECDPCACVEQVDSTTMEVAEGENGIVEAVNKVMNNAQTKAKVEAGRGACRHAGCGCTSYQRAWDGSGGKCVCGHWDYVHN